ncbi:hypothetical protein ID866_8270, partial [Astraeus odoratus]
SQGVTLWNILASPIISALYDYVVPHSPLLANSDISTAFNVIASSYELAWIIQAVFDALVFGLTLWKLLCTGSSDEHTFVDMLIRDGTLYFAFVL